MKVALVVHDGVQAMDVAGVLDVFAEANRLLSESRRYQVSLVGERAGGVTCSNAMQLCVPWAYVDFRANLDVLLVTGAFHPTHVRPKQDFLDWLRRRALESKRYGCVCNGAWLLGRAGLLDGKEIVANWADASQMAGEFPRARIRPDKNLIRDGRLISSGGATAGLDLGLSLVSQDWGQTLAEQVARRLGAKLHSESCERNPCIATPGDESTIIRRVQRHIDDHLSDVLSIEQLAGAVHVSRRTLSRIFAKHLHTTPNIGSSVSTGSPNSAGDGLFATPQDTRPSSCSRAGHSPPPATIACASNTILSGFTSLAGWRRNSAGRVRRFRCYCSLQSAPY
ncbi:GlxA family transcriptional regulator [Paraburkholderia sp. BR14374]|uniref:GlxA family transcriptional regulator n=1 Tax=Paraburkholderia sp. BR14374 TaxID=3237007 RepID=UPI0034CFF166